MEKTKLFELLKDYFNLAELRDICFELDVDYENLAGEGKGSKARELILYLDRRGRTNELLEICQRLRPNISWTTPSEDTHHISTDLAKTRVLFLAANPLDSTRLRLDEESRAVDHALRQAKFGERFEIRQHWAVRVTDVQSYLLRHRPDIVHFSGHGRESSEIILEDKFGDSHSVTSHALKGLFSVLKDNIRCVVLNACYSEQQAEAIAQHIDCVIGMSASVGDDAAISFASAFYQALGYGRNVKEAFDLGCVQIDLEGLDEQDLPKLLAAKSNPKDIVFVHSA